MATSTQQKQEPFKAIEASAVGFESEDDLKGLFVEIDAFIIELESETL